MITNPTLTMTVRSARANRIEILCSADGVYFGVDLTSDEAHELVATLKQHLADLRVRRTPTSAAPIIAVPS